MNPSPLPNQHLVFLNEILISAIKFPEDFSSLKAIGLEFNMKNHILHVFRTSAAFKEKSYDHFEDCYGLKLLTNFDVNMISFLGEVPNHVLNF